MESLNYIWVDNLSAKEWDAILASLGGHPLQSATWGDSKKTEGVQDARWCAYQKGLPVFLARMEERRFLHWFKIAWIPRGFSLDEYDKNIKKEFLKHLRKQGFLACLSSVYKKIPADLSSKVKQHTICLDLTQGLDTLWMNLNAKFRGQVRSARKKNIMVSISASPEDMHHFYDACINISREKKFSLHTSRKNFNALLKSADYSQPVCPYLFVARKENVFCGGILAFVCGNSIHTWLAVVDRKFCRLSIGELLYWEVTEWACKKGLKIYDLEGIDVRNNHSVYEFKRKMNGETVAFPGIQFYALSILAWPYFIFKAARDVFMRILKIA